MADDVKILRVGLVGPLPPPFGGMANQTRQLAELLASEGVDVRLVQTNPPYPPLFAGIKGVRAVARLLPYLAELRAVLRQVDCLHVMANSGWSWQLFAAPAVWLAWSAKVPVVVNYRGGEAEQYFRRSIRWVAPTLNRIATIVVPSGFLKAVFARFGFNAQIIPNIVDFRRFSFNDRTAVQDPKAPRLIVTRNLEAIYGIDVAVEAVALLKSAVPDIKLLIAGSGPLRETLQSQIDARGLAANIELTGKLTPDQVAELYAGADIMLNPTTVDNTPNSVLEALACGIPVVSTRVGGIPYIVTDNETALLVEVNDAQAMAASVLRLVNDAALYQRLAKAGASQIRSYAWDTVKHQWLELYRRLARQ